MADWKWRLYWEIARLAFHRQLTYRAANLAGIFTNAFFGYIRAALFPAAYAGQTVVGGYDLPAAITYSWASQSLLMVIALWSWWDVEETIRTGDVVSDLSKPFSYVGFWLARDAGRAVYYVFFRCLPILLAGQILYGLRWPPTPLAWLLLLVSLVLAVAASFGWRFLLNLSAFWTTDARGLGSLAMAVCTFLGGFVIPIRFFPDWAQPLVLALPFAAIVQPPADFFAGRLDGEAAMLARLHQLVWAVVLIGAGQLLVGAASRRVALQGG